MNTMINYIALEEALKDIRPYSRGYYVVQTAVKQWGHWKGKPRGGSFKKGPDPRRGDLGH